MESSTTSKDIFERKYLKSPDRIKDLPEAANGTSSFLKNGVRESSEFEELNSKSDSDACVFDPLSEETERYLMEEMRLPSVTSEMLPRKCYVNYHVTESDFTPSVSSMSESWHTDMDNDCNCEVTDYNGTRLTNPVKEETIIDENNVQEREIKRKEYPKTKEALLKRRVEAREKDKENREQVIHNLEKQMMSLYKLKEQYKRNLRPDGCDSRWALPPITGGGRGDRQTHRLATQRDSIINKIRRKSLEEEKRKQSQLDRKLYIIQKLLSEQRSKRTQDEKMMLKLVEKKKEKRIGEEINRGGQDTLSNRFDETYVHHKPEGSESEVTSEDSKKVVIESEMIFNDDIQEANIAEEETKDVLERDQTEKATTKTTKNEKIKKTSGSRRDVSEKSKKKKGKKSVKSETGAAITDEKPELQPPASEIQDLMLWFENWRETREEQFRILKEIEDRKIQDETEVLLNPNKVIFEDCQVGIVYNQEVKITNVGRSSLQCRVRGATDLYPLIQTELKGPSKAGPGSGWTLHLTTAAVEEVTDSWFQVQLLFCRCEALSTLSVNVDVLQPRADPALSTTCIRFGEYEWWSSAKVKRAVQLRNSGGLPCLVTWQILGGGRDGDRRETQKVGQEVEGGEEIAFRESLATAADESFGKTKESVKSGDSDICAVAIEMVEDAFENVFEVFRVEARQPLLLPAHSSASAFTVPVTFLPSMSLYKGDVFATIRFLFESGADEHHVQDLLVCATVLDSPFSVEPALLDLGVCWTGGVASQGRASVRSCVRHACSVTARLPRRLAGCVRVTPKTAVVQAQSSVTLAVRLALGWSFLEEPCPYLDRTTGLLSFPVLVDVRAPGPRPPPPPLVLTVMAAVVPPCPLTINPSYIDLGQVSTLETVSAKIQLINHYQLPYTFAFVDLPQSMMIEPGGGCGTILAGETLDLLLLFSPRPEDLDVSCGMPGVQGNAEFTLKCFTTVSFASAPYKQPTEVIQPWSKGQARSRSPSTYSSSFTHSQSHGEVSGETSYIDTSSRELIEVNDKTSKHPSILSKVGGGYVLEHVLNEEEHSSNMENTLSSIIRSEGTSYDLYAHYTLRSELGDHTLKDFEDFVHYETDAETDDEELLARSVQKELENKQSLKDSTVKEFRLGEKEEANKTSNSGDEQDMEETKSIIHDQVGSPINLNDIMVPASIQRYASFIVRAFIVDPLVELSSQAILLPPTPCKSSKTAHFYIRGRNQNKCRMHKKNMKFKTSFEFKSPIESLSVEPEGGCLGYMESLKISLIFNPTMSQKEIFDRAFEMKREELKWTRIQQMLEQYYKSKEKKQKRSKAGSVMPKKSGKVKTRNKKGSLSIAETKKKSSEGSAVSTKKTKKSSATGRVKRKISGPLPDVVVLPEEVVVTDDDMRKAEAWLLRYLEPKIIEATLTCLLRTDLGDGNSRMEQLQCRVVCPLEAPALAPLSAPVLQFGPTAIGSAARKLFDITNVSFWDAPVHLSTLNPVGPFRCPVGLEISHKIRGVSLELPPEHIMSIPIVFQPIEPKEVSELVEVWSGGTVLMLKACGRGVAPSYTIIPEIDVFTITARPGKKAEFTILVGNTCEAPLDFKLKVEFIKEGFKLPENREESPPLSPASAKNEGNSKKSKKKKSGGDITLITPELMQCIENDYVDLITSEPAFKVLNVVGEFSVSVGDTKKLNIRFNPPQNVRSSRDRKSDEKSNKSVHENSKDRGSVARGKKVKSLSSSEVTKEKGSNKTKKGSKIDRGMSVISAKEKIKDPKKYIAAKFILFVGVIKAKEWIFLGSTKK